MSNYAERRQAEWVETYADYTVARLTRRVAALTKQIETKARAAESAKWSRRDRGERLQSTAEQRANAARTELTAERYCVQSLLDSKIEQAQ